MERIKFHIKRNGWGLLIFLLLNEIFLIAIGILGAVAAIINRQFWTFIFVLIPLIPPFLWIWCRNTVTIIENKMVIRFGLEFFHVVVDISKVSNVHYKQQNEKIKKYIRTPRLPFQTAHELESSYVNVPFQKPEETVCFTSARGNHYYLAVKEHEKLYELLKKREVYPEAE